MSSFFYGGSHGHAALHSTHPPHAGRRRAARASHNPQHNNNNNNNNNNNAINNHQAQQKQARTIRIQKDLQESALERSFRRDFDAARSFDIEDDELFCPFHLLTEDDLQSISSSGSDRSSLSSGSPDQSPLQPQLQPSSTFLLPPSSGNFPPTFHPAAASTKLHQPLAQRTRNAIPIVDPSTRVVASPPQSISPARQMQQQQYLTGRRW